MLSHTCSRAVNTTYVNSHYQESLTIEIKNSYRFATDGAGASVRQVLREVGVRAAVHAGAVATGRVAAQKALQPMSCKGIGV